MPVEYGIVGVNNTSSFPPGSAQSLATGPSAERISTDLHDTFYTATRAGNTFNLSTATAGTIIPVQATNLVSTFTLWNPLTSGKNVELLRYSLGLLAATTVISDISLYYQSGVGQGVTVPGTLTALAIRNTLLGAGLASVCSGYSAATLVNVVGTNFFRAAVLATFGAVTSGASGPINYDFKGTVVLPPGSLITVAGNAAQTAAMAQSLTFSEWPV